MTLTRRLATETITIGKWTIPQGACVLYNHWLVNRDPESWPEPNKFDPERFRPDAKFHPCAFAPFGMGDRKCLGYQVAKPEMKMIICDLLPRYKVILKSPQDLQLVTHAINLSKPKDPIIVSLERVY